VDQAAELADRLDFRLPDFTRVSWTSDTARATWKPRVQRIGRAWAEVEWSSVAAGLRRCSLTRFDPDDLPALTSKYGRAGLSVMALGFEGASTSSYSSTPTPFEPGKPSVVAAAVGRIDDVVEFSDAWRESDHEDIGELLGYPPCCRAFFRRVWIENSSVDTTWAMARNTVAPTNGAHTLEVGGPGPANILWRWACVRAVPHLPCAFDCGATAELGAQLLRVGVEAGYADEMGWIEEILSWPVEWTALHGIAEVKTPILKVVTRTDATASRYVVRRAGTGWPHEGATGLAFPFEVPDRAVVSDSAGFHRGLEHPIALTRKPARPEWYHRDNGFSSQHGMDRAHEPLVGVARAALDQRDGGVLDLGCGNGVLLSKIVSGRTDLVPYGMDRTAAAIAHARELQPRFADNFLQRDFFDVASWVDERRYRLALLMIGRLLEVPRPDAARLLDAVRSCCDDVVLYVYPGYRDDSLSDMAGQLDVRIEEKAPGVAGLLVLR
jgi:SAM-dependent methyltransferase